MAALNTDGLPTGNGAPGKANGFSGERRSNEMNETLRLRTGERYAVCDDDMAALNTDGLRGGDGWHK